MQMAERQSFSHRDYVIDRTKRVNAMIDELKKSKETSARFFDDPVSVANKFNVKLTEEEIIGIKFAKGIDLVNLAERLTFPHVAFFDSNCHCPGPGPSAW
jgi:hypothetical protein